MFSTPRRAVDLDLDQVAVGPHPRVVGEVGVVEPPPVGILQEADRTGGERVAADELADGAGHLGAVLVDRGHVQAEAAALAPAAAHRELRVPEHETAEDVGTAADRLQR
jgi:hypothetical protein